LRVACGGLKFTPMGVALLYTFPIPIPARDGRVVYSRATPCGWPGADGGLVPMVAWCRWWPGADGGL